ncbi:MAG: AmmeMemoRadiSam system protein B [Deltaproteobacteria bacterium]|nr:MAG: AmmeMemoRadiSam system protein B [Deltaproteobacteria bacterium]
MDNRTPRVRRDLEFLPVQQGGKNYILVRDHLGLVSEGTALPPELFELLTLLDGSTTLRDLQMHVMRKRGGVLVSREEIERILSHLDERYLLESEHYLRERDRIITEFSAKQVRPCAHCGVSYPGDPEGLTRRLEQILSQGQSTRRGRGTVPTALVAPHIDLGVGAGGYAAAYNWLGDFDARCVIVLGVGHKMMQGMFCLTEKDFDTPLGRVTTEKEVVRRLRVAGGGAVTDDDFPHRSEHSIEFQVLLLQYLSRNKEFSIVPILCGSLWQVLSPCTREAFLSKAGEFIKELSAVVQERGESVLVVAGVDMSHVGPKFGHERPARYLQNETQAHDRRLLGALVNADANGFWDESQRVQDRFNVCGFSALACLLEVLPPSKGTLLYYDMWFEGPTQSAVSFCAAGFVRC